MLSVVNDAHTKIEALNIGADDYLTKPFFVAELLARIRALLRREKKLTGPKLIIADLTMDTLAHTVTRARREIKLNRKEFMLLEYFMRNAGTTLTARDDPGTCVGYERRSVHQYGGCPCALSCGQNRRRPRAEAY